MTELRAPDPTLTAYGMTECDVVKVTGDALMEAHHLEAPHADGPMLVAVAAAYIAVPCRECFPVAPPRGERANSEWPAISKPDPHLAWQVTS